jgi:hypothetical protein
MSDTFDKIASNFIATLSKEELDYCTHSDRGEYLGFSALHDLMDANVELLNTIEKLDERLFSSLKIPSDEAWVYLNKCIDRIDEKLKKLANA